MNIYLKHSMSCLPDQAMAVAVDHPRRRVRLSVTSFDSALVARFAAVNLPADFNVTVLQDDRRKDGLWLTEQAPYRLIVAFAGKEFAARVVMLIDGSTVAVTLEEHGSGYARGD